MRTVRSFAKTLPTLFGTILLVSLLVTIVPPSIYKQIFTGNPFIDPLVGAVAGSISAGNPVNSYIIAGELLKNGVSLLAVTAFIVSWVTVGIIQMPAEAEIFGRRFAILRNLTAFILALIVAWITVVLVGA